MKFRIEKYISALVLGAFCMANSAHAFYYGGLSPENFNKMYYVATLGKVGILREAVNRGLNIDSVNPNGDTGLCIAVKKNNYIAYNTFRMAGANPRHSCTYKMYKEYSQFLLAIMDFERPLEQTISGDEAYDAAKELIKNGLKVYGNDLNLFKKIFVEKSREDLILIARAYFELSKKSLYDAIESEVGGKNRRLLKGLLFAVITPAQWFAKKCYKAIQGLGGDNNSLIRVLISRAEIDMYAIRDYYFMDTNHEIKNDIEDDTAGAYGQILVNLSLK